MGMHGTGWGSFIRYDEDQDQPAISWGLIKRVIAYARPYWTKALLLMALIIITTLLGLVTPLLFRDLLDNALPNHDSARLNWLALGFFAMPAAHRPDRCGPALPEFDSG